jgi:ATP/maltotriose-dependent transcriptional regulator MalT
VRYGQDPEVICLGRLANTLWFLGRTDEAARASEAALARADEIGHAHTRDTALIFAFLLALEMGDEAMLRSHAAALVAACANEHIAVQCRLAASAAAGLVAVLDGDVDAGIARTRRALEELNGAQPAPGIQAVIVRLLLEECRSAGRIEEGLEVADLGLRTAPVRLWEAEVRRVRAELLAASGSAADEVERELVRAREVARRQGSRAIERRIEPMLAVHGR